MIDEAGQLILPGAFIPAAERYNLMSQIDFWVIRNAFAAFAEMNRVNQAPDLIFINLSGASLSDDSIFRFMREQIEITGINPKRVCFEITETAAIANLTVAVVFIQEMKRLGFRFALDDFGAGLSSFAYLKTIPVDFLKVDGSFIRDMLEDDMDAAIVSSIQKIGHVAGLQTIAEFVESDAILSRLVEIGFDYAQGYAIHVPEICRFSPTGMKFMGKTAIS
jgi:EAL domain-containing protein (putative c-di-GMP-specific phosphodiesterase class I)